MARRRLDTKHSDGRSLYYVNPSSTGITDRSTFEGLSLSQQEAATSNNIPAPTSGEVWVVDIPAYTGSQPVIKNVTLIGDSLADGLHSALSALYTDRTVFNAGIGGDRSFQIRFRKGDLPVSFTVAGGSIPASGGVVIVPVDSELYDNPGGTTPPYRGPMQPRGDISRDNVVYGTLRGIAGRIERAGTVFTFTRTAAGSVTTAVGPCAFTATVPNSREIQVIIAGRNNYIESDRTLSDIAAMVTRCSERGQPYLVLTVLTGQGEEALGQYGWPYINGSTGVNTRLKQLFPGKVLDWNQKFINTTPPNATAQDGIDKDNQIVPVSWRQGAGNVHPNATGNAQAAIWVAEAIDTIYPALARVVTPPPDPNAGKVFDFDFTNALSHTGDPIATRAVQNLITANLDAITVGNNISRVGKGIQFVGAGDSYIDLTTLLSNIQEPFAVSAMVRIPSSLYVAGDFHFEEILFRGANTNVGESQFRMDMGGNGLQPRVLVGGTTDGMSVDLPGIALDTNFHITLWYTGTSLIGYLNGTAATPYAKPAGFGTVANSSQSLKAGRYSKSIIYSLRAELTNVSGRTGQQIATADFNYMTAQLV